MGDGAGAAKCTRRDQAEGGAPPEAWRAKFAELKAYVAERGCMPPCREVIRGFKIGLWVHNQRRAKKCADKRDLSPEQAQDLESLQGWWWARDPATEWQEKFAALKAYVAENHRIPTDRELVGDFRVGTWVRTQRRAKKGRRTNRITAKQIQALETIPGWWWERAPSKQE
jgi:hypothetical protein